MDKRWMAVPLVALPLAIGGWVYASAQPQQDKSAQEATQQGYICPITGEELPCCCCCPLNDGK